MVEKELKKHIWRWNLKCLGWDKQVSKSITHFCFLNLKKKKLFPKDGSVQIKITAAEVVPGTLQEQTRFIYSFSFLIALQNNEITFPDS